AMNLSQLPMVTYPTLKGHFGAAKSTKVLESTLRLLKSTNGYATGSPAFLKAREEMISQGKIDVGQAPELASFAEGANLSKLGAGTNLQRNWRTFVGLGMKMFGVVEQFNREMTMKASWELAMQNLDAKRLKEIEDIYPIEVADLENRLGFTHQE